MSIIDVNNLTKDYGHGRGVFDVSFHVDSGEVFGFLGPNGAGKTTTIRHIMGFSKPQQGSTSVMGMESYSNYYKILSDVGYLPGEVALPSGLTGNEFIKMMQELRKSKKDEYLKYLLDKFKLDPSGDMKRMSLGVKRKLAIVTAFMDDPKVLILDEPTSGLDPIMQNVFIDFILEEKKRGKTILLSSHIFHEVDATCDRIAIIKDGKIVSEFIADDLKHNENKVYQINFNNLDDYNKFKLLGYDISYSNEQKLYVKININDKDINRLMLSLKDLSVKSFTEEVFSLQDFFMNFYNENRHYGGVNTNETRFRRK